VRTEGATRGLGDVEGLERDRVDLGPALRLVERGVFQDADDLVGVGAELLGGGARPGGAGERGQQQQGRDERAGQAMTLIRACRSARPVNGFSSTWARILARKRQGSGSSTFPVMKRKRLVRSGRRMVAA
jgi:hypothetical protein